MDPFYPYPFFHGFHFFGGLLMLFIGILIGRAAMRRRLLRQGVDPAQVYGGCCRASRRDAPAATGTADTPAPAAPRES